VSKVLLNNYFCKSRSICETMMDDKILDEDSSVFTKDCLAHV
jgi:hypothetical protein